MTEAAPPPQEAPLPPAPAEKPKTNALAIVSLICGIAAVPFAFCFAIGIVPAIAGIITGHLGLKKSKASGSGRSLAIAGLVISYIAAALCIVMIIILIAATGTAVQELEQMQEQMQPDLVPTESALE